MQKKNVIIVDDHDFFRLGLRTAIENYHPDITIVAEAKNGTEFFAFLKIHAVDLVLLDLLLPDMSGIEIARRLKEEHPEIKILAISAETSVANVKELLEMGIEGFISKFGSNMDTLADAMRAVTNGLEYYGRDIAQIISQIYLAKKRKVQVTPEFSEQEKRIIECCHEGLSGKQIADRFCISYKTMEWHKANIFRKLNIHSTLELVRFAMTHGIIR